MDEKPKKKANRPPRRQCLIKITLQNALLGDKYCVYKQLKRQGHIFTYLTINIKNWKEYVVKLYRLDQIEDDDELLKQRYRVFRRMEIMSKIKSPNVIKYYEVYENQSYMAVVLEYIPDQFEDPKKSLAVQFTNISQENYSVVAKQIFQGMDAIRKTGFTVKAISMEHIYFKNGYYKITDFPLFQSEKSRVDKIAQVEADDVLEFGLLFLKIILKDKLSQVANKLQELVVNNNLLKQNAVNNAMQKLKQKQKHILEKCLKNKKQRIDWSQLKNLIYNITQQEKFAKAIKCINQQLYSPIGFNLIKRKAENQSTQLIDYINQQKQYDEFFSNFTYLQQKGVSRFMFTNLTKEDIKNYQDKRDTNYNQTNILNQLEKNQFQVEKSKFIINEVINPIKKQSMLDLHNRNNIQFMYIVSSTCFKNISFLKCLFAKLSKQEKQEKQENTYLINLCLARASQVYDDCKKLFQLYSEQLTNTENSLRGLVSDIPKKFLTKQKEKNNILNGIEGVDYQRQEIIDYTCKNYIEKHVIQEIERYKNHDKKKMILKILKKYKQIWKLEVEGEVIKGKDFQEVLKKILYQKRDERN